MTHEEIARLRQRAQEMTRANPTAQQVLGLVAELKIADEFSTARLLLNQLRQHPPPALQATLDTPAGRTLASEHSLCTYKDTTLDSERRHRDALAILRTLGLTQPGCADKEILGQGGAIYKRMWEHSGTLSHLHTALGFYRAGWERDPAHDLGWCGVNAAYVLDLLAWNDLREARRNGHQPQQAAAWQAQASALRKDLRDRLPALQQQAGQDVGYWAHATLAEVHFGLGDYAAAQAELARAAADKPDNWERKTTARQLISIARLHGVALAPAAATDAPDTPGTADTPGSATAAQAEAASAAARAALAALLGGDLDAALQGWRGKVGLALSGGGFRASLFHLGVLARLAECDVLPSIETLSTVSGGSILGAQYYLALRELLQTRPDNSVGRQDYVQLVRDLIGATVTGVGKNLRVRALANPYANLRMTFDSGYSRSMRMGQLYERYLLAPGRPPGQGHMLRLCDLLVKPPAAPGAEPFRPGAHNWLRQAKVPNLMLNTTSLNTGHDWHFTVRWMGEPPGLTGDEIDMNARYRRVYYDQAPTQALQHYPLAYAVAASSCVPALFEPLPVQGLYENATVRLVDGGVHDNQGMGALLDDDCNFILCSDASGQMDSQSDPANGLLGVFWRTNAILQDRVREAQYRNVRSRAEGGALQGLFFIHMKQDLESAPVDYIGSTDARPGSPPPPLTPYDVDRTLQALLSDMRTDLDSFSEVECYALMASGYRLASHQLHALDRQHQESRQSGHWGGFAIDAPMARSRGPDGELSLWPFAPLLPLLANTNPASPRRQDLLLQLQASALMFGRSWVLIGWLRHTAKVLGGLLVLLAVWAAWQTIAWFAGHWGQPLPLALPQVGIGLLLACLVPVLAIASLRLPALARLLPERVGKSVLLGLLVALPAVVFSGIHLLVFEPLLQRRGRLARLMKLPD